MILSLITTAFGSLYFIYNKLNIQHTYLSKRLYLTLFILGVIGFIFSCFSSLIPIITYFKIQLSLATVSGLYGFSVIIKYYFNNDKEEM